MTLAFINAFSKTSNQGLKNACVHRDEYNQDIHNNVNSSGTGTSVTLESSAPGLPVHHYHIPGRLARRSYPPYNGNSFAT